jgi:hypothetical protein
MGEDQPRPAISVFHATLLMADQCSGRLVLVLMPCACGPRNWGQFVCALAPKDNEKSSAPAESTAMDDWFFMV